MSPSEKHNRTNEAEFRGITRTTTNNRVERSNDLSITTTTTIRDDGLTVSSDTKTGEDRRNDYLPEEKEQVENSSKRIDESFCLFCKVPPDELPDDLKSFLSGLDRKLPSAIEPPVDVIPSWLNMEKIRLGQSIAMKYYYAVNLSEMFALMTMFAPPNSIDPLVHTGKSHTTFAAYKRYLSTTCHIKSWYETEFWKRNTEGYENLKIVRRMHVTVQNQMLRLNDKPNLKTKLAEEGYQNLKCPMIDYIAEDFARHYNNNNNNNNNNYYVIKTENGLPKIHLNQFDMSLTQVGFYGIFLLYRDKLGATKATDDDLDAFVHLWRYLGYLLGIEDEFNACKGDYEQVKKHTADVVEYFLKPTIGRITDEWEHMARCAIDGIGLITDGLTFEKTILHFGHVFNIDIPNTLARCSTFDVVAFKVEKFILSRADVIPIIGKFLNLFLCWKIEQARKATPETVRDKCRQRLRY